MVVQLVLELPKCCRRCRLRSGKNTHISRISNSVTHNRSYTNTTIADTGRNCTPSVNIAEPSADNAASSTDMGASIDECSSVSCLMMFHNVLFPFHDVLLFIFFKGRILILTRNSESPYSSSKLIRHPWAGMEKLPISPSNSVTHLRSYTNTAIANIAENSSPITPRRYHR